jgi:uncharacterized protein YjbI with pentapeptide repeats
MAGALEQVGRKPVMRSPLALAWLAASAWMLPLAVHGMPTAVVQLLDQGSCRGCDLIRADLAQAQLARSDLQLAKLEGANLSGAQLDGANLSRSDLSFASLHGASLRGANLSGARLHGTDLRGADLSGAQLDPSALATAHWQGAKGLNPTLLSYSELHNAGTQAAQLGRFPEAEQWFNEAIRRNPDAAISWLARGITRGEQGKKELAAQDLAYASDLYGAMGDTVLAQDLRRASETIRAPERKPKSGNGAGSALLSGAASAFQVLAPLALKAFMPVGF